MDTTFQKKVPAERDDLLRREQEVRAEAERASRVKDECLAIVSHELRTPRNAILGWARMLAFGQLKPGRATRVAEIVERNAQTQASLVADLPDVTRIITGKLEVEVRAVSLSDVVHAAVESVQHEVEHKKLHPAVRAAADLPPVAGDSKRLQQVVANLLSNARRFTPSEGTIEVDVRGSKDHIEVIVRDSGQDIRADALPQIFDRFHQAPGTRRSTGGLALGLAVLRHIVDAHHGTVEAHSQGDDRVAWSPCRTFMP